MVRHMKTYTTSDDEYNCLQVIFRINIYFIFTLNIRTKLDFLRYYILWKLILFKIVIQLLNRYIILPFY